LVGTTTTPSTSTAATTTQSTSATNCPPDSFCRPNPCEHGQCIESAPTNSTSPSQQFACICDEYWFGRLCDEQVNNLTTTTPSPARKEVNQTENELQSGNATSSPRKTVKRLKTYVMNFGNRNQFDELNQQHSGRIDLNLKKENEAASSANLANTQHHPAVDLDSY